MASRSITGASAVASGTSGGPSVSLTTTTGGAVVFGTGNDADQAVARTIGPNQKIMRQWVDTVPGSTYWVQRRTGAVTAAGTVVQLNDTTPIDNRWNFAAVEIVPR